MVNATIPLGSHHPDKNPIPPPMHPTPPIIVRGQATATRTTGGGPTTHPAVYAPWSDLIAKADARYKTEISAALQAYERAAGEAGQILDRAYVMAAGSAAALEAAAWTAWQHYMSAADDTRSAIVDPALAAYDGAISTASAAYTRALADAEKTYKTILDDANRAKADAGKIQAA